MFAPPLITKVWLLFPKKLEVWLLDTKKTILIRQGGASGSTAFCSRIGEITDATLLSWGGALAHSSRPPVSSPLLCRSRSQLPSLTELSDAAGEGESLVAERAFPWARKVIAMHVDAPIPRHRGIVTCYVGEAP